MPKKPIRIVELFSGMGTFSYGLEKVIGKDNVETSLTADFYIPAIYVFNALRKIRLEDFSNISYDERKKYLTSLPLSKDSKELATSINNYKNKDFDFLYANIRNSIDSHSNVFDIRNIELDKIPSCDLLTYSFPCQDISNQGIGKGFKANSGKRSSLLWEVKKIIDCYKQKRNLPEIMILENVSAIINKNHKPYLEKWLDHLNEVGYKNEVMVLDSSDYGSVQCRKRVFVVSVLKNSPKNSLIGKVEMSMRKSLSKKKLGDLIVKYGKDHDYYKFTNQSKILEKCEFSEFKETNNKIVKSKLINYSNFNSEATIYHKNSFSPTLTASGANSRIKVYFDDDNSLISNCPLSSFQIMGYSEKESKTIVKQLKQQLSFAKMIHVAGNAISLEVVKELFKVLYIGEHCLNK